MDNVIRFLAKRKFINAKTSDELLQAADKPLLLYIGFDPTADSLHLGNLVGVVSLFWFQKFGHSPAVLLGGGTGKIGDPSGKSVERSLLDVGTLEKNIASLKTQFKRLLGSKCQFFNNNDWLSTYSLIDFLRNVGKYFRLGPMLAKESVRSRLHSEEGISFTEFSYQVLQGYDFFHLYKEHGVQLQIGGSDQWGNITAGIELTRKLSGKTVYGLTYPLLTRSDGTKFGKSEEGAIWLDPTKTSPYQFYQYLFRLKDEDVITMMRMLTFMEIEEIEAFETAFTSGHYTPNAAQKRLAEEVTRFVHGSEGLELVLRVTEALAPGSRSTLDPQVLSEIAKHMPNVSVSRQEVLTQKYVDVAVHSGLCASKGEASRLIKSGGAYLNNDKIEDLSFTIKTHHLIGEEFLLLSSGKKKRVLVKIHE